MTTITKTSTMDHDDTDVNLVEIKVVVVVGAQLKQINTVVMCSSSRIVVVVDVGARCS